MRAQNKTTPPQEGEAANTDALAESVDADANSTGYASACTTYWDLGWRGVLPLPAGRKEPAPRGFTGHDGADPSYPDVLQWADAFPGANLCLRLPDGVIGVDVDAYGSKRGATALAAAEKRLGPLPFTPRSSSRPGDPISGIRLFRVPAGFTARDRVGDDVEIVQHHHRYAVVWPSRHPEGRPYQWFGIDGGPLDAPPGPADLAELPAEWLAELRTELNGAPHGEKSYDVFEACTGGDMSDLVRQRLGKAVADCYGGSRHDHTGPHVLALLRHGKNGETGVQTALDTLKKVFVAEVGKDRGPGVAAAEFDRFISNTGAGLLLAEPGNTDWLDKMTERAKKDSDEPSGDAQPSGGGRLIKRDGLQVLKLANAVTRSVRCGFGAVDDRFYVYDHGVWIPNHGHIEATIARLLGNRYRGMHCRNTLDMIRYSDSTPRITRDPLPEWINAANGMIRWRDGTLHPHSPDHRSTVQLPVDYQPDAECPAFQRYLAEVLPPDCYEPIDGGPGFIWELIGYALYSGNPLHVAVLLHGNGRNGKGTLIRLLKRLIGDRNCSTVTLHELVENRFRAATLYGKLANLAGDLDARWLDNTASFKSITGGDTIQGEYKYGAVFDFHPWALPVYSTNKPFGAADSSEGWVARWVVVPFPQSFLGRENRNLDAQLQTDAELRGVLRRAVAALPALMARGRLPEPKSVHEAKQEFVTSSDAVRSWLDEECALDPDAWTDRAGLYRAYCCHTDSNGGKRLSAREFYARLGQINGIHAHRRTEGRGFRGVRLLRISDWSGSSAASGRWGAEL
jgi:putative DNA primase/helicase